MPFLVYGGRGVTVAYKTVTLVDRVQLPAVALNLSGRPSLVEPVQLSTKLPVVVNQSSERTVQGVQLKPDFYRCGVRYERIKKLLPTLDISEKNKELLAKYDVHMCSRGLSLSRKVKYLYILIKVCQKFQKDYACFDSQAMQELKIWMNSSVLSKATQNDYIIAVKMLLEFIGINAVELTVKGVRFKKLPPELLTEKEVEDMVNCCTRIRDKAIISLLYELGARIGEILNLKVGDVVFDQLGAYVMLDGKTGQRRCRIVKSVPLVQSWLLACPTTDSRRYLWIKSNKELLGYPMVRKLLKGLAKQLGIQKRVYPHLLRHSRATVLAKHLTEQQLKVYLGWTADSNMASTYVHLSGKDVDNAILQMNGSSGSNGDCFEEFMKFYQVWKVRKS